MEEDEKELVENSIQDEVVNTDEPPQFRELDDLPLEEGRKVPAPSTYTKEEQELVDQKALNDALINNQENKKKALNLAIQMQNLIGKNWFTSQALMRKSKLELNTVKGKLAALHSFGFITTKTGERYEGKSLAGKSLYKIIITRQDQIDSINEGIAYFERVIENLKTQKQQIAIEN